MIEDYTTKKGKTGRYVKTSPCKFKTVNGKEDFSKGVFVRVEALDQVIEDPLKARDLLK